MSKVGAASEEVRYWDGIAAQDDALPAGWRRHGRDAHLRLVRAWVGAPSGRWLKTDLFEERDPNRAVLPGLTGDPGTATWVGVDLAPETVRGARSTTSGPCAAADVRRLPFADDSFDGILSTSTLDHFDDRSSLDAALVELRRVLRPGGRLLLTLDNPANPLIRVRNALPPAMARRTGLVPFAVGCTLDEAGGRVALADAGFEVLATTHLLHAPHVVGTRLARFGWWERRALPRVDALEHTRWARHTGHFVAFLAG